jgi:hypothetical protein
MPATRAPSRHLGHSQRTGRRAGKSIRLTCTEFPLVT